MIYLQEKSCGVGAGAADPRLYETVYTLQWSYSLMNASWAEEIPASLHHQEEICINKKRHNIKRTLWYFYPKIYTIRKCI